jgi:hypothetical protein
MAFSVRRRFTADDYERMGDAGILRAEDRVELVDGEVVAMSPIGSRHGAAVDRANLNERVLLRFTAPDRGVYGTRRKDGPEQLVTPHVLPASVVSADDLL